MEDAFCASDHPSDIEMDARNSLARQHPSSICARQLCVLCVSMVRNLNRFDPSSSRSDAIFIEEHAR